MPAFLFTNIEELTSRLGLRAKKRSWAIIKAVGDYTAPGISLSAFISHEGERAALSSGY